MTMPAEDPTGLVILDHDGVPLDAARSSGRSEARLVSQIAIGLLPDEARAAFDGRTLAEHAPAERNATRVHEAYTAFAAGNGAALVELLREDVVYNLPGKHLGGGTLRGQAELFDRLAEAASALDDRPTIRIEAVAAFGEWVLTIERFRARRDGQLLDQDVYVVWRMHEGRCAELWARFADQAACDRFWEG